MTVSYAFRTGKVVCRAISFVDLMMESPIAAGSNHVRNYFLTVGHDVNLFLIRQFVALLKTGSFTC
jgi:hypothetical protein